MDIRMPAFDVFHAGMDAFLVTSLAKLLGVPAASLRAPDGSVALFSLVTDVSDSDDAWPALR